MALALSFRCTSNPYIDKLTEIPYCFDRGITVRNFVARPQS